MDIVSCLSELLLLERPPLFPFLGSLPPESSELLLPDDPSSPLFPFLGGIPLPDGPSPPLFPIFSGLPAESSELLLPDDSSSLSFSSDQSSLY